MHTRTQKTHTVTLKSRTTIHSTQISCCYMVSTQNQQSDQNTWQLTCLTVTLSSRCSPAQSAQATPRNSFTAYVHTAHNHSPALTNYPTTSRFCSTECRHTANAQLSQTGGEPYISKKYTSWPTALTTWHACGCAHPALSICTQAEAVVRLLLSSS